MWVVDELKAKGFVKGAVVKYVRGARLYQIVSVDAHGLVTMRILNSNNSMGMAYEERASRFLQSHLGIVRRNDKEELPYSNRS